ncbi:MAG: tRNA pseudouridine(38-40) synthase TruA [Cyclobacteriaceae bacterium]|nr:tRNA pseudouridine(38-40) synthase TruA [Cyclobacteriaceae bacterium]
MHYRYFADISYKGTQFHGWQSQQNAKGIQEVIEEALSLQLREKIEIMASGRTDKGVHALQQIVHFDIPKALDAESDKNKLNAFLPEDISINQIIPVQATAHARYDAVARNYIYKISRQKNPFLKGLAYEYKKQLDLDSMQSACDLIVGRHNFQSFSLVKTNVNNFFCDIYEAKWLEHNHCLEFHVRANRFLRGMVRALTGTLLLVGEGKCSLDRFQGIIESRDRKQAGRALPPEGLYLSKIEYPLNVFL